MCLCKAKLLQSLRTQIWQVKVSIGGQSVGDSPYSTHTLALDAGSTKFTGGQPDRALLNAFNGLLMVAANLVQARALHVLSPACLARSPSRQWIRMAAKPIHIHVCHMCVEAFTTNCRQGWRARASGRCTACNHTEERKRLECQGAARRQR